MIAQRALRALYGRGVPERMADLRRGLAQALDELCGIEAPARTCPARLDQLAVRLEALAVDARKAGEQARAILQLAKANRLDATGEGHDDA